MWAASYHSSSYRADASVRSRSVNVLMALLIGLLLIYALLKLGGPPQFGRQGDGRPLSFEFLPAGEDTSAAKRTATKPKTAAKQAERTPPPRQAAPPLPPPPVPVPGKLMPLDGVLNLSRDDFAKSDVDKLRAKGTEVARADAGASGASGVGSTSRTAGTGPAGQTLYAAEWYREPARSQTAPYMPAGVTKGWGIIACRTIDRYHVDDCQELGETPGSGISRGLRQAAWQFLVRPPRIDGKPQIGAWVRIRFDIVEGTAD